MAIYSKTLVGSVSGFALLAQDGKTKILAHTGSVSDGYEIFDFYP